MINRIKEICMETGELIRAGFGKNFSVEFKTNESNLVTEIDKKAETHILNFIKKNYPSHGILSEESGEFNKNSEYLWVVDPLDGTTNFAHGLPIFAISIGVQKSGETIAGAVYDVMRDVFYSTELGGGAFENDSKISVSSNHNFRRSVLVTGFPYNIADNPDNAIELFIHFLKTTRAVRRLGSAAIDLCYTAKGVFDAFWEVNLHPWDVCAGKLLVEEAGGIVSGFYGEKIDIFSKRILATNKKLNSKMVEEINKIIKT